MTSLWFFSDAVLSGIKLTIGIGFLVFCVLLCGFVARRTISEVKRTAKRDWTKKPEEICTSEEDLTPDGMMKKTFPYSPKGYAPEEVQALLQRIACNLRLHETENAALSVTPEEIAEAVFHIEKEGYDRQYVDAYLDQIIDKLEDISVISSKK